MIPHGSRDWIDATGTYEDHLASLKKNFRSNLKKARNKLRVLQDVRFVTASTPEDVRREFEVFLELERSGWKGIAGTTIAQTPHAAEWYRAWLDIMARDEACEINALYVGTRCIASQLWLKTRNAYEVHKVAYDVAFSRLAPGQLLTEYVLKRCFDDPAVSVVDLMSDAAWHDDWCARKGEPMSMAWIARTPLSTALIPLVRFRFGTGRRWEKQLQARKEARIKRAGTPRRL
jgi:CelD/BcsL family acetyltransferase involved in cellulose biosynthesis